METETETVPSLVHLRGGAVNHAESLQARALMRLEDAVEISDQKSIDPVLIRPFPINCFHHFLETDPVEVVETVKRSILDRSPQPFPATLHCIHSISKNGCMVRHLLPTLRVHFV